MMKEQTDSPSASQFHDFIFKLNYFRDLQFSEEEINTNQEIDQHHSINSNEIIQNVPLKFYSENSYNKIWENLFFLQAKAQIVRAKMQQATMPQAVEFLNLFSSQKYKTFNFKKILASGTNYIQGGLVVISPLKSISQSDKEYPHLMGICQSNQSIQIRVLINQHLKQIDPEAWKLITTSKEWYIQNICPLVALQRQFKALKYFNKINSKLKEIILRPDLHNMQLEKKFRISQDVQNKLKGIYNDSQYKAIVQCLKQEGVTLIQGPPGTGKTKTVLGTLSVLINSFRKDLEDEEVPLMFNWAKSSQIRKDRKHLNPWLKNDWIDWRDQPLLNLDQIETDPSLNLTKKYIKSLQTDRRIIRLKKSQDIQVPGKVAICGPSNASVDQIIRKLLTENLIDEKGLPFLPNFVRIGQNYDRSLQQYSLQFIANKIASREKNPDLNEIKGRILKDYKLVFGTLSAMGNQIVQSSNIQFDTVVIDEAGQSIQISNLIPLVYGCKRLILIGDPNQLPATVFSNKCLMHKYDQSLFERMMKNSYPVLVLKTQYRMSPQISQVIGDNFYGGQLLNYQSLLNQQYTMLPRPFLIFHVQKSAEYTFKKSYRNIIQAYGVKNLVQYLSRQYKDIGVVSPYSQQVRYIQSLGISKKCEIKTIDSFQGRQKNVIVFSAVRSRYHGKKFQQNKRKTIGFVADARRINVSLSRAKTLCVIICDAKRLCMSNLWKNIIMQAKERNQVYKMEVRKDYFKDFKNNSGKYLIKEFEEMQQQ